MLSIPREEAADKDKKEPRGEFNSNKGLSVGILFHLLENEVQHWTFKRDGQMKSMFDESYMIPYKFQGVTVWVPYHLRWKCVHCGRCCIGMIKPIPLRRHETEKLGVKKVGFDTKLPEPVYIDGRVFNRRCQYLVPKGDRNFVCDKYRDRPDPCRIYPAMLEHEATEERKKEDPRANIQVVMGWDTYESNLGVCLGWSVGAQDKKELIPIVKAARREWEYYLKTGRNRTMYQYKRKKSKKRAVNANEDKEKSQEE